MNDSVIYSHVNLTRWVSCILSPIILLGCALGNIISFIVLLRPRLRRQTTSIYLAVLCVAEIGTCYTGLLRQFLLDAFDLDIRRVNSFTCRTHILLTYVFLRLAPLLLALVTLQRYLYVSQRAKCSLKSTCIQLTCLFLFVCFAEGHLFTFYDLTYSDTRQRSDLIPLECTVDKVRYTSYYSFRSKIYPKLTLFLYTIIPLVVIILGNFLLVRTVRQASKRSRSTTRKKRSVTRMLYAVSVLYTVLTSPASIFLAVVPASYQLAPGFRLQWTLLRLLFYLCHSVNFLLFCASGTFFRQEFASFINANCICKIEWANTRTQIVTTTGISKYEDETMLQSLRYLAHSDVSSCRSEIRTPKLNGKPSLDSHPTSL
ncbi:unnamed protein product [Adineta steineri]|uniref:G-protein coupled receptors family 1 profile domain-containing protein n=1 Tax=Adineta steineri TaxID=433720 RepID=A0A819HAF2_9BILA|nr:unnamed protein product [Adineta steineri]CAF1178327.1 unnamed protein product [Adineta steineri]CAF1181074.1 unnamed protein product [Adineta steineri]CAF3532723.1 unnamed protein product [Adineta steineri]CAF3745263.1 unnamed protein product [Adineta steineri]